MTPTYIYLSHAAIFYAILVDKQSFQLPFWSQAVSIVVQPLFSIVVIMTLIHILTNLSSSCIMTLIQILYSH